MSPRLAPGAYHDNALAGARATGGWIDRGWGGRGRDGWRVKMRLPMMMGDVVLVSVAREEADCR